MSRIHQLIIEIKHLRKEVSHRSALQAQNILVNNSKMFEGSMEADDLKAIIRNFTALAEANPNSYQSEEYKREFQRCFDNLLFHLNRII